MSDDSGAPASSTLLLTVNGLNDPPRIATLDSSAASFEAKSDDGQVSLAGTFLDVDLRDSHTATVDWGNGAGPQPLPVDQDNHSFAAAHTYGQGGIFQITVTVSDGIAVTTRSTQAIVTGVGLIDGTLFVIGTDGRDLVNLTTVGNRNRDTEVKVVANLDVGGAAEGARIVQYPLSQVQRIEMHLCDGDDRASVGNDNLNIPAIIYGGAGDDDLAGGAADDLLFGGLGNDRLRGWGGNDVLIGGDGDDDLDGGFGDDLLIGGRGADKLRGDKDRDLLIGGSAAAQAAPALLNAALAHWTQGDLQAALIDLGPLDDDGEDDQLFGGPGDDELIGHAGDQRKP